MKIIIRIAFWIIYLISFQVQTSGQNNLPLVCAGSRVRYGVSGSAGSTYEWKIVGGSIFKDYSDSVDVQWDNNDSIKSLSVMEHTGFSCISTPSLALIRSSAPRIVMDSVLQTCANQPLLFKPLLDFHAYLWDDGTSSKDVYLLRSGWHKLQVSDSAGCTDVDSVRLIVNKLPYVNLGRDTMLCSGTLLLNAGNDGIRFAWSPIGGNQSVVEITPESSVPVITVEVENMDGCISRDTIKIYACQTDNAIPNAFTPNGDYDNDTWKLDFLLRYPRASVDIFDRWGRKVFSCKGNFPVDGWDGTHNGKNLPMDTYYFIIKLNDASASDPAPGAITLIR